MGTAIYEEKNCTLTTILCHDFYFCPRWWKAHKDLEPFGLLSGKNKSGDIDMMVGKMKIPAKFEGHELHKKLKVQLSAAFLVVQISGEFNGEKN